MDFCSLALYVHVSVLVFIVARDSTLQWSKLAHKN